MLIVCTSFYVCRSQQHSFSIGINPLTLLEPQAGIGPAAEYTLSNRFSLFAETNYLFNGSYLPQDWNNLSGYRFIFQPRYFITKQHDFFIAPEFRIKSYSYNTISPFITPAFPGSIIDVSYRARQIIVGGAINIGGQFFINKKKNLYLDILVGIGEKQRSVKRNVPDDYEYYRERGAFGLKPNYEAEGSAPYFPAVFRFMRILE